MESQKNMFQTTNQLMINASNEPTIYPENLSLRSSRSALPPELLAEIS
jgi:hypothetical protein